MSVLVPGGEVGALLNEMRLPSFCERKTSGKEVALNDDASSLISRANGGPSTRVI